MFETNSQHSLLIGNRLAPRALAPLKQVIQWGLELSYFRLSFSHGYPKPNALMLYAKTDLRVPRGDERRRTGVQDPGGRVDRGGAAVADVGARRGRRLLAHRVRRILRPGKGFKGKMGRI